MSDNFHRKVEAVRTLNAANPPLCELLDEILSEHPVASRIQSPADRLRGAVLDEELPPKKLLNSSTPVECGLVWRRDGAAWILLHKRRRLGRVVADDRHAGMYRVVLDRGRLSNMASLSWAKNAALVVAELELAFDDRQRRAIDPAKCPQNEGVFNRPSSAVRRNPAGAP